MAEANQIRLLPDHVINQIAAGEVVDRPVSVLKELVENALDAGARNLDVHIMAGGRKLVAVTDDGCGMSRDDALLSIERHATSKIRAAADIEAVGSLGFRGEALAAIAAVSRFRLRTCRRGDTAGTELVVTGGKLSDVRDAGCPCGTCIEVRDLFFNMPARRKFLRSHGTELAHLRAGFTLLALSHPSVGLRLRIDNTETCRLPGSATLEERIGDLSGPDRLPQLRRIDSAAGGVRVHGYAGLPSLSRSDRAEQYVFVNGRATSAPLIGYAIREGYHTLLPQDRHPVLYLFVELPAADVDVNVHPAKKEVRFRRPGEVRDALIGALRDTLRAAVPPAGPGPETAAAAAAVSSSAPAAPSLRIEDLPPPPAFRYPRMPMAAGTPGPGRDGAGTVPEGTETQPPPGTPDAFAPWTWCRVLGQAGGLFVVLETDEGVVLMDPHAAHERVLFERFMREVEGGRIASQRLLLPQTVELEPRDAQRIRRRLDVLRDMGFALSEFGGDSFVVDALPAPFSGLGVGALLLDIARALEQAGQRGGKGRWREASVARAACRAAVKARQTLTVAEIERLVNDLARAQMPYTCPHGRPTLIFMSFHELKRKFGRE
jgi:DNA mismatch repair protein MutL